MSRPIRDCPAGFADWYREHRSMAKAMRTFRASRRLVRRWVIASGLKVYDQRYDQAEQKGRQRPADFVQVATSCNSVDAVRLALRARRQAVLRWYREAGLPRPPVGGMPRRRLEHVDPPRSALIFLRTHVEPDTHDFGETYEAMTGGRYVVGRKRLRQDELLDLARVYGWRG